MKKEIISGHTCGGRILQWGNGAFSHVFQIMEVNRREGEPNKKERLIEIHTKPGDVVHLFDAMVGTYAKMLRAKDQGFPPNHDPPGEEEMRDAANQLVTQLFQRKEEAEENDQAAVVEQAYIG